MRVLFVNRFFHPDHSATSQMLTDLANDLSCAGVDIAVITGRQLIDDPRPMLPSYERMNGIEVYRVWSTRFGRQSLAGRGLDYLSFYFGAAWRLARLCASGDVVVAKTDPPLICVVAALVARRRGAYLVNWLHDLFPEIAQYIGVPLVRGPIARVLRRMRDRSLRVARCNVAIGSRMYAKVCTLGIAPERVLTIHNWGDGNKVRPKAREGHALRAAWNLEDRFVVSYSGNMGYAHEFGTMLDAAERLRERTDITFLFIGGGVQRATIEEQAVRRRLGNVRFEHYQPREKLCESLTAADAHLVTLQPKLEGLMVPSKFYAIAAAGRPVLFIGARDGEIARLVDEAQCGWWFEVGAGEALAERIEALSADPLLGQRRGAAARRLLEERFERRLATDAWRRALESVAAGG